MQESGDAAAMRQRLLGRRGAVAILRMLARTWSRYLVISCFNAWKQLAREEGEEEADEDLSEEEDSRQLAIKRIEKELLSLKADGLTSDRRKFKRPQSVDPASVKEADQWSLSRPKSQAKMLASLGHSASSVDQRRQGKDAAESPKSALKQHYHSMNSLGGRSMSKSDLSRANSFEASKRSDSWRGRERSKSSMSEEVEEQIIRLIRLGRTNSQVLSHYAVAPYGVSEDQVETMRESFIRNPTVGFSALRRDGSGSKGRRSESEDSEHEESLEIRYGVSSRLSLAGPDE